MTNLICKFVDFFTDFPLTNKFRATNLFNAFVLNSMVTALTSAFLVEFRLQLSDNKHTSIKSFIAYIFKVTNLRPYQKIITVFIAGTFLGFIVYDIMYYFVGFGDDLLQDSSNQKQSKYW